MRVKDRERGGRRNRGIDGRAAGVDVIPFDEPAFNVYMDDVRRLGIAALERAIAGLKCTTCVHICYGYGIQANVCLLYTSDAADEL